MIDKLISCLGVAALVTGSTACVASDSELKGVSIPVIEYEESVVENVEEKPSWKCDDCTENEQYVLEQLQKKTRITDRNALATILGNIKQESLFVPNICEGGARVSYHDCHSGGYGLIQWTSIGRYKNLGRFADKFGYDPSTLEGQTAYMINESTFQRYLPMFEGSGLTVRQYMVPAYYWLGWGIKGNREIYAYEYVRKLQHG